MIKNSRTKNVQQITMYMYIHTNDVGVFQLILWVGALNKTNNNFMKNVYCNQQFKLFVQMDG